MGDKVPRPVSVAPPDPGPEEDTSPGQPLDKQYFKKRMRTKSIGDRVWAVVVATGATAAGLFASFTYLDNRVQAQTRDAGELMRMKVDESLKGQEARLTTLEKRFDRYDAKQDRQTELIEMVADQLKVSKRDRPPPVPPLSPDGGR